MLPETTLRPTENAPRVELQLVVASIAQATGTSIVSAQHLATVKSGRALVCRTATGRSLFVKVCRLGEDNRAYAAETEDLRWLGGIDGVNVPEVLAFCPAALGLPAILAIEFVDGGTRPPGFDEELGRTVALLHRAGAPSYGAERDNFRGSFRQPNGSAASWADFYCNRRLEPLLRLAVDRRLLDPGCLYIFAKLLRKLDDLVGPPEPPARLHGNLSPSSVIPDRLGRLWLVDPAAYGGHREADFCGLDLSEATPRFFDAYTEVYPLEPGYTERLALYQLHPLLIRLVQYGKRWLKPTMERAARLSKRY